jgi:hypothetical protein
LLGAACRIGVAVAALALLAWLRWHHPSCAPIVIAHALNLGGDCLTLGHVHVPP